MQQNQPSRWIIPTGRMAFCLAALISLGVVMPAMMYAEGGSDLNITKDGGDVNVNLSNASSSDVSIRRSDDIMIIKVPKSYKGGISIDPALKKSSVVQEMETPNGRAITIQSQQIYLHTSENGGSSTPAATAHPAPEDKKTDKKAEKKVEKRADKTESKAEDTASTDDPIPGNAGFLQLSSPTESNMDSPGSGSKTHDSAAQPRPEKRPAPHRNPLPLSQPAPMDISRLLDQSSLLSEPFGPSPSERGRSSHHAANRHQASAEGDSPGDASESLKHANQKRYGEAGQPTESALGTIDAKGDTTQTSDPEMELIEDDNVRQAAAIQAAIYGMLRIFFSLLLVLGMIFGFVKVVLPKLLERYPDFFERLKERKQWSGEMPNPLMGNRAKPTASQKQASRPAAGAPKNSPISISALAEQFLSGSLPFDKPAPKPPSPPAAKPSVAPSAPTTPAPAIQEQATKKNYLERLKVAGEYFQVLQSTILGKGKELHLVELQGRQFLVATTPYTVTLLKDLSEETVAPTPQAPATPAPQQETRRITQQSSVYPPEFPSPSMRPQAPRTMRKPNASTGQSADAANPARPETRSEARSEVRSETIAYLSDETPIRRVSPAKPYATPPGTAQQARRKSNIPHFPAAPVEDDYPTYLASPPVQPSQQPHPQTNQPARPNPAMAGERPTVTSASQPAYIDAEEVVVLEDYDDIYGR